MKTLLFVCTGNTCRSPMAQGLASAWLSERGITDVEARSAGLSTRDGLPAAENAVLALRELGIDLSSHRSTQLIPEQLDGAALLITMTAGMRDSLSRRFPDHSERIVPLLPEGDVDDPYGGSIEEYRSTRDRIAGALPGLLSRFIGEDAHG